MKNEYSCYNHGVITKLHLKKLGSNFKSFISIVLAHIPVTKSPHNACNKLSSCRIAHTTLQGERRALFSFARGNTFPSAIRPYLGAIWLTLHNTSQVWLVFWIGSELFMSLYFCCFLSPPWVKVRKGIVFSFTRPGDSWAEGYTPLLCTPV